ncbi:MAG: GNAT family N-acetyltransferase [Candidatus Eremiobacteraeota bacterium]|nr:GNAT family N-acetyltransferase [Candidatus Eremiobacteraeota bacterium]
MSPKSSYQRHTPGRVPFENAFSWQEEPCSQRIAALSEECRAHDGHRNLDDGLLQEVLAGSARSWLEAEGRAYVQLGERQMELLIHPEWRGQGWGSWLLQRVLREREELITWAYGDREATVLWLERHRFQSHRLLFKMRYEQEPPAPPDWPSGWRLEPFQRSHTHDWHQLHVGLQKDPSRAWSLRRLEHQLTCPETPPERFWLLWEGLQMRGYVWLKEDEIFLLALDPACRGQGLGRRMLQWAMSQSRRTWGYCDESETVALYRKLGFSEEARDRCLRHST